MRSNARLASFCLSAAITLTACASREPLLPADAAREIKDALGYVLAPTYLPDGFEPAKATKAASYVLAMGDTKSAILLYTQYSSDQRPSLMLDYPGSYGKSSPMMERLGMSYPEDAVSEIRINGETAYLFHGRWTEDTLDRVARLTTPFNPEWDYDNGHISLRFAFVIPNGGRIWVRLATVFPTDQVTEKDIVRVAESIAAVD